MAVPPEVAGQASESSGNGGGAHAHKPLTPRESVVIRFAGDSGDGMQLVGMQFTSESALAGNDIATVPDFPAEIRAPAGTLAGVSSFQLNFSSSEIFTAPRERRTCDRMARPRVRARARAARDGLVRSVHVAAPTVDG